MRELQDLLIVSVLMMALVVMLNIVIVLDQERVTLSHAEPTTGLFAPTPIMPPPATGDNQ